MRGNFGSIFGLQNISGKNNAANSFPASLQLRLHVSLYNTIKSLKITSGNMLSSKQAIPNIACASHPAPVPVSRPCRCASVSKNSSNSADTAAAASASPANARRDVLVSGSVFALASAIGLAPSPSLASGNIPLTGKASSDEYAVFYGFATPPTSYGKLEMGSEFTPSGLPHITDPTGYKRPQQYCRIGLVR